MHLVVGIAGGSASGKSTLARALADYVGTLPSADSDEDPNDFGSHGRPM